MSQNRDLHAAKRNKKDEFYTQLTDIQSELSHYTDHFRGRVVYCNCDDPRVSSFFKYFSLNFEFLGLKKLITTCYKSQDRDGFSQHDSRRAIYLEYEGDKNGNRYPDPHEIAVKHLNGNGDFRSEECIEMLKQSDIVCTNPPFSLFREYVSQLMEHDKKFLIIGRTTAIDYKEMFPLIKDGLVWLGHGPGSRDMLFDVPDAYARDMVKTKKEGSSYRLVGGVVKGRLGNAVWFTNLDHSKRHRPLILDKTYRPDQYSKYDNYDAINVDAVRDIPEDYRGVMGVPSSFLDKFCPEQFEIVGQMATTRVTESNFGYPYINGKKKYARILIRHKEATHEN
ncbi:MAG: adenine-specific methyltransferase EcoRI family protein [Bacteroidetes bacterium]|nr:adenine-specific methyltransferase EcoRI family protein [Bacteroidota bacterium]